MRGERVRDERVRDERVRCEGNSLVFSRHC